MIDDTITNQKFIANQIVNIRTPNFSNICSDYKLVLCKFRMRNIFAISKKEKKKENNIIYHKQPKNELLQQNPANTFTKIAPKNN